MYYARLLHLAEKIILKYIVLQVRFNLISASGGTWDPFQGEPLGGAGIPFVPGEPLGPINQGGFNGGVPLDPSSEWFDPTLGSGQAAVFQDVNLSDFLPPVTPASSGNIAAPGLRTVNGDIIPLAETRTQRPGLGGGSFGSILSGISRRLKPTAA